MRVIRLAIALTACFWLVVVIQQLAWIPHAMQPRFTDDPLIGGFARSYVVTSSLQILLFAVIAAILAVYVYRSRRAWAAVALCVLFVLAFWQYFLVGLPLFFRAPLGDGSLHGALVGYVRFHSTGLWLHLMKLFLLLGCFSLWLAVLSHISHAGHPEI